MIDCTSSGKVVMVLFTTGMIKKMSWSKMSQYFSKPKDCSSGNLKVVVDLFKYAKKADLKRVTAVDTSNLAAK